MNPQLPQLWAHFARNLTHWASVSRLIVCDFKCIMNSMLLGLYIIYCTVCTVHCMNAYLVRTQYIHYMRIHTVHTIHTVSKVLALNTHNTHSTYMQFAAIQTSSLVALLHSGRSQNYSRAVSNQRHNFARGFWGMLSQTIEIFML